MLYQAIVLGLFIKKNASFEASKVKFTLVEIGKMAIMTVITIFALGYIETLLTGFNKVFTLNVKCSGNRNFLCHPFLSVQNQSISICIGFVKKKKK